MYDWIMSRIPTPVINTNNIESDPAFIDYPFSFFVLADSEDTQSNATVHPMLYPQPSEDSDIAFVEGGGFVFTDLTDPTHIRTDEHGIKHYVPPTGELPHESE